MDEVEKKMVEEAGGIITGVTCPMSAVYALGTPGVSAVGLTTGIAALGFGSMFFGVGVIALLGIGGYVGGKKVVTRWLE